MADKNKPKRKLKQTQTVRQQAEQSAKATPKRRKLKTVTTKATKPLGVVSRLGGKEYHPIKLPDNRVGRFLSQRRRFFPKFFLEAWGELKQVTWPSRRETIKLTFAVLVFALVFGALIAVVDYGLDKLFRNVILS